MANEKVTQLPTVTNATTADIIYAVQAGTSVQETLSQVLSLSLSQTILNFAGDPNGNVAGTTYQLCWDTVNGILYVCTTSGTTTTAVWTIVNGSIITIPVPLSQGGTGKALVSSNGGLVYSDADSMEILSGTATAGQIPRSGASSAPSWSTATYPATTVINELLYSSANNVITGLATLADGILTTDGSGVPAITLVTSLPFLPLAGGTMTGDLILNGNPTTGNQAANKAYVDTVASGIIVQLSCFAATTANLAGYTYANGAAGVGATLTAGSNGAFALDGTSPALNSRILVKDQTSTLENGIYTLTTVGDGSNPAVLTRATNYDTPAEILPGDLVPVDSGTVNAGTAWLQTATVTAIGTDPILFSPFAVITAGVGLTKVGSVISLDIPVTVDHGGTGDTSLTAYAVLCGGTTSTDPVQSVAGVGTAGQVLTSNGAAALPTFQAATATTSPPQLTVLTSGSGTYTTPVGANSILVEMVGGGGGGAGASAGVPATAGTGTATTFDTLTANGGGGGFWAGQPTGGTATGGDLNLSGANGSLSFNAPSTPGTDGASSYFGGEGRPLTGGAGGAAVSNTGSGGGTASTSPSITNVGSSGAAGGYLRKLITSPAASYSYAVGTGGTAGVATRAGGAGGSGLIIVTAYF